MGYSIPSLVRFGQLLDPMKKTYFWNSIISSCSKKSQISVWKTNFFPRQAIPKILFVLQSSYPWDTRCRVWFDLDNSLTRWKRPIFKYTYSKLFGNKKKFPYEKLTFFLGKLYQKFFLFYNLVTHGILDTKFGSIWTTSWPNEKDLFLKFNNFKLFEKIANFRMKN